MFFDYVSGVTVKITFLEMFLTFLCRFSAQRASLSGVLNATRPGTKVWSVETTRRETNCYVTGQASSNTAREMLKSAHAAR